MSRNKRISKIKNSEHVYAVKIKTESNGLGVLKTMMLLFLIFSQAALLILSSLYLSGLFNWLILITAPLSLIAIVHALSSEYNGQAKATWVFFLFATFTFGYIFYFLSDKRVLFANGRKKYRKIFEQTKGLQKQNKIPEYKDKSVQASCNYLYNSGEFAASASSKAKYFPSGASFFDSVLEELEKAKEFIFIEFYIFADGVLFDRVFDILQRKVSEGVDVRIIYDDMGSHGTFKRKTKKKIRKAGIKLVTFNRMLPVFIIALNIRDHRKIVVVDGKVAFTGGANLADEYINEKRSHGYWKDAGIKIEGRAVDNFSKAFLMQWNYLTKEEIDYKAYLEKAEEFETDGVIVPFVTGPHYHASIAQNMMASVIANATEKLFIMSPYFVPDETITNLIINKARSGVDVRIVLPEVADKKFVYIVSRNNAEKLIDHGVKVYTLKGSFVHSKVVMSEDAAIVGSINMDLRSFNQQFESAVYTNQKSILCEVEEDFDKTIAYSTEVTKQARRRNKFSNRVLAGLFNIVSPFM